MIAAPTAGITPFQSASLYVGDLNPDVTESVLFELFNRVGPVASIRVCRDSVTRRSLGYAYVNFHNVQDAERALDTMNFTDIQSKPCRIMWSQRDPSLRKTGLGNVFVRNLAPSVDNKGLYDTFSVFGNILSCKVATDETGKSKGYGYVHFESAESAQDAIQKFDGMLIDDMEVHVGMFVRRQDRTAPDTWTNLYVKQFPTSWDDDMLRKVFEPYGTIQSLFIQKDETGKSKGFGFINYETHEAAAKAVDALHNKPLANPYYTAPAEGQVTEESDKPELVLYVGKAQKKADRIRELKTKQDSLNLERITKFQGMNLYVKNISDSVSDEIFRDTFTVFGPITSARIMREANEAKTSKGFGFVCFQSADDAAKAVAEMNGKNLGGKPLYVTFYQKKDVRRAQFAANYAPAQMHRGGFQGGNMGGPMPFMGMYMPQQGGQGGYGGPRGGPGGFNNQFGGPRGPMQPRGPGGNMPPNMMGGQQGPGRGYFPGNMPPQGPGQGAPYMQQGGMPRPRGPPQQQMPPQQFPPLQQGGFPGPRGMPGQPGPGPRGMPNMPPNMQPRGMPPNMQGMPPNMQGMPRGMYPPNMPPNMMPPNMQPQFPGMPGRGPMPPNMAPQGPGGMPPNAQVKFTNQARNMGPQPGMMGPGGMMPPQPMPGQMGPPNMPPQKMDFSEALLATADPMQQKNMIGERLYPLIFVRQPEQAGKITGMLLEMDNGELLNLIESPEALHSKIDEALTVLRNHNQG